MNASAEGNSTLTRLAHRMAHRLNHRLPRPLSCTLRTSGVLLLCGVIGILPGCGNEAPSGYFPLEAGLTWRYQVTTRSPAGDRQEWLTIKNYGRLSDGSEYYMRGTSSGNYYYFSKRDDSITRVARNTIINPELKFDNPARPVIKEPVKAGTAWQSRMRPYLLTSQTEPHLKESILYEADWSIVATDAVVETPVGQFQNCLHIRGKAAVEVPRSFLLHLAPHTMLFEINEWYAPDVGLVKLTYSETTDSKELKGGTINLDLVAFEF